MLARPVAAALVIAFSLTALLAGCGQPRPPAQQGEVCRSMAQYGQLPWKYPDITPAELQAEHARETTRHYARQYYGGAVSAAAVAAAPPPPAPVLPGARAEAFRNKLAAQATARRGLPGVRGGYGAAPGAPPGSPPGAPEAAAAAPRPQRILSVSAGGAWGAFSIGFLEGWGENTAEPRPRFDVVTGVSTGSMIAVALFLGDPAVIAKVRTLYATLKESDVYTVRPVFTILSSTSLFDTAPLRAKLDALLTDSMVETLAAENANHRTLAVMATNLDSGVPEPFDLTEIAADTAVPIAKRREAIVGALMASSAEPVAFPPEMIRGNLYVDGGVRVHAFFANELRVALVERGLPVDLTVVVSGDMAVTRDCTGTGSGGLGLLSVVGRTASVAIDQLLVNSVQALLAVGLKPDNQARMINARRLINYYGDLPPPSDGPAPGKCKLSDKLFDPAFEGCLVDKGTDMGRAQPIQWDIQVWGAAHGQPPRISALQ